MARAANVTTVTTSNAHRLQPGAKIFLSGVTDTSFNDAVGTYVTSTPSTTSFTIAQTGPDGTSTGGNVAMLTMGRSLSGGVFYDATQFPPEFDLNFFTGDYVTNRLFRGVVPGGTTFTSFDFWGTAGGFIDVTVGPDGALYYASYGGQIYRASHNRTGDPQGIVVNRRNIRFRISILKDELEKIEKQRVTQRKSRSNVVRVALVGYTNVGKSTLMNLLSKSDVKAENRLFATVDATVRKVVIGDIPFLLSDTVGFIRKLPHHLIESFKSTLDEVREADILLHVVDMAHPFHDNQIEVVSKTLAEIGAGNIPVILVLNKMDRVSGLEDEGAWETIKGRYREQGYQKAVLVSATTKQNVDRLRRVIIEEVKKKHMLIYPNYVDWEAAAQK